MKKLHARRAIRLPTSLKGKIPPDSAHRIMFTRVEALRYRSLKYVSQDLTAFHVLVGPNASGKSTFLDVISFLGALVTDGIEAAVNARTQNFQDLVWQRGGGQIQLAVEAAIPPEKRSLLSRPEFDTIRYEVALEDSPETGFSLLQERVLLTIRSASKAPERVLFPEIVEPPDTLFLERPGKRARTIVNKVPGGNDNFYSEVHQESGKGWAPAFKLGPRRSALGNLPADESKFPATVWLRSLLGDGVQQISLNSQLLRLASPPGQGRAFKPDGSNLPWVIDHLSKTPELYESWLKHVRTALVDIESIRVVERQDDRHSYLMVKYVGGLEVPSWGLSDGTLRLLALTLIGYLPGLSGCYLIEEPENGIHPRAVETVIQSLTSVYRGQVLVATHSPVILSAVEAENLLCFAKTPEGATDIVLGPEHPSLRDWKGQVNLSVLFAAGVLG